MSALPTITARCVHCAWRTDVEGEALVEARDVHELLHPGGTMLVGEKPKPPVDRIREIPDRPVVKEEPVANGGSGRRPRGYWTRERVIEAIQAFHAEHGRVPAHRDLGGALPTDPTIRRFFSTMNAAIEAAGFESRPGGRATRHASDSSPSSEGPKSEAVPPPATKPKGRSAGTLRADSARACIAAGIRGESRRDTRRARAGRRRPLAAKASHAR